MSAPDPVAALREYVRAEGSQRRTGSHAEGALLNEAPRLLAHVERLEAALVEYAVASDRYCDAGEPQSRYYGAQNAVLVLGREIAGREP